MKNINKEAVVKYYQSNIMTLSECAEHFNLNVVTIHKILNEFNISVYSHNQLFNRNLIENYFEKIDTKSKAYLLGMLITDGCIFKIKNTLVVSLNSNEKYILDFFRNEVKATKKITSSEKRDIKRNHNISYQFALYSNKMASDLNKYGITERKTGKEIFIKDLKDDLYPYFIRGLMDGDGSFGFYQRKNKSVHYKHIRLFSANKIFIEDLQNFLLKKDINSRIEVQTYNREVPLYNLIIAKKEDLVKFIHYIYDDLEPIYIKYKKDTAMKILDEINNS